MVIKNLPFWEPILQFLPTFHVNPQPMAPNDFMEFGCQAYQTTPEEYRSLRTGGVLAFWEMRSCFSFFEKYEGKDSNFLLQQSPTLSPIIMENHCFP